jgi:folate-binding protein YgfZ
LSDGARSALLGALKEAGGIVHDHHGRDVVRHFGDPHAEYEAAVERAAVFDRSHRSRLVVRGRAPGQMLGGILTGTIPGGAEALGDGVLGGLATYHAVLTHKGRMVTDLWCLRVGDEETDGYLLDVPVAGAQGLREMLAKYLPPRLATVEDVTSRTGMISLVGPEAASLATRLALGLRVQATDLSDLSEGEWRCVGTSAASGVLVVRAGDVWPEVYTVVGPAGQVEALWRAAVASGARPAGLGVWSTLRVEAGRPEYGTDMDVGTIPVEAGIHERAIDYSKGCYTGQEVIVRIRDRGHVNRNLRQLLLGEVPTPARGTELFVEGQDKPIGVVTSAVSSPRFGQTVALGYVRRGVEGEPRPR